MNVDKHNIRLRIQYVLYMCILKLANTYLYIENLFNLPTSKLCISHTANTKMWTSVYIYFFQYKNPLKEEFKILHCNEWMFHSMARSYFMLYLLFIFFFFSPSCIIVSFWNGVTEHRPVTWASIFNIFAVFRTVRRLFHIDFFHF